MSLVHVSDFDGWRTVARQFLRADRSPETVRFADVGEPDQGTLFGSDAVAEPDPPATRREPARIDPALLKRLETVSYHRSPVRWDLMYRIVWRVTHDESHLFALTTDDDVVALHGMERAIRRDVHKTKAFVRFRKVTIGETEHYVAWHRPDHRILPLAGPFFARRFPEMRWTILTPDESVHWDQTALHFGPGVPRSAAPIGDEFEDLWRTYYRNIFNPARLKVRAMKKELPVRHWPTLPEADLIEDLIDEANTRVRRMLDGEEPELPPMRGRDRFRE